MAKSKGAIHLISAGDADLVVKLVGQGRVAEERVVVRSVTQIAGSEVGICCDGLCCDGLKNSVMERFDSDIRESVVNGQTTIQHTRRLA